MADFRLDDDGTTGFNEFGEETNNLIREHCYPELEAVLASRAIDWIRANTRPLMRP